MFYELAFLSATFFVAGSICLGGALMRIPQYDDEGVRAQIRYLEQRSAFRYDQEQLAKQVAHLGQDMGEGFGQLRVRDSQLESRTNTMQEQIDKVGHDLYRHFSLSMKKKLPKGGRK